MKPSILYYSDCSFFAGCENMIANFLNDYNLNKDFAISFAFNYSEKYESGLNTRVINNYYQKLPIYLLRQVSYTKPTCSNVIWSIIHKFFFAFFIPFYKYVSIFINTILLYFFFIKRNIDILHINNGGYPAANSCYSAVLAARMAGITKIVYVVNNLADDYKHPFRWLDYPLDFFIKKWVTIFITGSKNAGERLQNVLNLNDKKLITINNGIHKREITLTKCEFKKKYSIPENRTIVSVVANLEKRKGHIYLLYAILQIKEQYSSEFNPFFIFEGFGPEKATLKNFIYENGLQEDVLMIDFIPDIFNLINTSEIIVLPSISNEDFPNIIIESMSLGKPVIGTKIAGIPEQIEDNKTGFLVQPKNPEELKNAIIKLLSNPSLIQQFSIEAKIKFDKLYEKSISIKKYIKLYRLLTLN